MRFGWFPDGWFSVWIMSFGIWFTIYCASQFIMDLAHGDRSGFFAPLPADDWYDDREGVQYDEEDDQED